MLQIKTFRSLMPNCQKEVDCLADWLKGNELVVNLKKGKTESLLFGTSQRIAKQTEPFEIKLSNQTVINNTTEYKYLGVYIDSLLDLNPDFHNCFKKASCRLRILAKIRRCIDQPTAATIFIP